MTKIVTITDDDGNRPVQIEVDSFECPVCNGQFSHEHDDVVELDDGQFVCESCWRGLGECGECGEEFVPQDEYTLVCSKCKEKQK